MKLRSFARSKLADRLLILFVLITGMTIAIAFMLVAEANAAVAKGEPTDPDSPEEILTDLMIGVDVSSQAVRPGETFAFTLRYTNTKGVAINTVKIENTVSSGQVYLGSYTSSPVIPPGNFTISGDSEVGYTMEWDLGTLSAGSGWISYQMMVTTTIEPYPDDPIILLGSAAEISGSGGVTSGQDDEVTTVVGPIFQLEKEAGPEDVLPGHILNYTLTLTNLPREDSIAATSIVISDALPEHTTFYAASAGGGYDSDAEAVVWNIAGPLNPGASQILNFSVRVNPDTATKTSISNKKTEYEVRSSEINLEPVHGKDNVTIKVGALLQKTVWAPEMSKETAIVWPGDLVTYTITVYNPLTSTLNGVVVTDTLPGDPGPTFEYQYPVYGSPAPAVVNGGKELVYIVNLPPWGSVTRSFVARVPFQTYIPTNKNNLVYYNTLSASHIDAVFTTEDKLAPVKVNAPVTMSKKVSDNLVLSGETVIYTITVTNDGPYLVNDIRLTDTLEGEFAYIEMIGGPVPVQYAGGNPVVWDGLSVASGEEIEFSFRAVAIGYWLVKYYNNLDASSPDVYIPNRTNLAYVKIDTPIKINKTVTPDTTFIATDIDYTIELLNISTETWTLVSVEDDLPDYFYQVGGSWGNVAVIDIPSPASILAGGTWQGSFTARVSTDVSCANLPVVIKNLAGQIETHFTSPVNIYAYNATALAPLTLEPNIVVDIIPYRKAVQAGNVVSVTLRLYNQSPIAANDSTVRLTLPSDLSYQSFISGPAAPFVDGQNLTWEYLDIPANTTVEIVFLIQVATSATPKTQTITFSGEANNICFGSPAKGDHFAGDGKIYVKEYVVELKKKALNLDVPPLALVEYQIELKNYDYYPYPLEVVIDTMPAGFTYYAMSSGPEPVVQGNKLYWYGVILPENKTTKWKMRLQAAPLYGRYYNSISASSTETTIEEVNDSPEGVDVLPLFDLTKDAGVAYAPAGSIIPYTIKFINLSKTNYSAIVLTDTLPAGFSYHQTIAGAAPVSVGENGSQPVWNGLSVKGNCKSDTSSCTLEITFEVRIGSSVPDGTYYNTIIASTPSGSIPGPLTTAPVIVSESAPPPPGGQNRLYLTLILK
jgi:uncharacterized repeat protein (TIGR01451 family)